ncbi:MAG: hypothetical protein KDE59_08715 [Anaerolineales bacterium]|nr:hypothetical protein [Anaerolineales bacterium]
MDEKELDLLLTEALNSYPMAQLPEGFNDRLLAQLPARAPQAVTPPERFRLGFLDISLSLLIALSMLSVTLVALWLLGFISGPAVSLSLPTFDLASWRPLIENNFLLLVLAAMGLSGAIALMGALFISLWEDRPTYLPA